MLYKSWKWLCKTKLIVLYNSMFEQRTGITTQWRWWCRSWSLNFLVLIQFKNYIQLITVKLSFLFWHHNSRFQYFLLLFMHIFFLSGHPLLRCIFSITTPQHRYNYAWQLKYSHSLTPDQTAKTHWKLQRDRPNGIFVCRLKILELNNGNKVQSSNKLM